MSDTNVVVLNGRIVRDPSVNQRGTIADTSIAVGSFRKDGDDYIEETTFVDLKFVGSKMVERANKLEKGKPISIVGSLQQEKWESKEGGQRSKLVVIVNQLNFLPLNKNGGKSEEKDEQATKTSSTKTKDVDIPF